MTLNAFPFAALFELRPLLPFLIPIVAIIFGCIVAIVAMFFSHERKRMLHETARLALEKGQPIPLELMKSADEVRTTRDDRPHPKSDVRSGLILIAVGTGLYLFFAATNSGGIRFMAAIPGLIGVALLIYGLIDAAMSRKASRSEPGPTQS